MICLDWLQDNLFRKFSVISIVGVISVLTNYYQLGAMKGISQVHLCADTHHYAADVSDNGWGCGYWNTQMLLSSLSLNAIYKDHIEQKLGMLTVPSVPKIQSCIEEAWKEGKS